MKGLSGLISNKSYSNGVYSELLKFACPAIAKPRAIFLTSNVRHGHAPVS